MKSMKHPESCPGCHEVRDCVCPVMCHDAKCSAAEKLEDLCSEHKEEYEQHLDDLAQLEKIQEAYERGDGAA